MAPGEYNINQQSGVRLRAFQPGEDRPGRNEFSENRFVKCLRLAKP